MIERTDLLASRVRLMALALALSGCSQPADSGTTTEALYQRGAVPVAPWVPGAPDETGTAGEDEEPAGSGGAVAISGSGGMLVGASGKSGSGGMTGTATGGRSGSGGMTGVAGMAGSGGMTGSGGTASKNPGGLTQVKFDFTTLPQGGRFQPKNAGVTWVQNSSGEYVTTIEVWAERRAIWLRKWLTVNPAGDSADAVSSATLRQHKTHNAVWDLKANGTVVPDGEYTLFIEVTDKDAAGASTSIKFTKGPEPQTVTLPDSQYYKGVTLTYE